MNYNKFPYDIEKKAEIARANVKKARVNAVFFNNKVKDAIASAKLLCHWHNGKTCMCPGNDFKKCEEFPDCEGRSAIEFEESDENDE